MKVLLEMIASALREEDIESLIDSGAPVDEYDSEAAEIAKALASMNEEELTESAIALVVARVWKKAFNRSSQEIEKRMPAFRQVARHLIQSN